MYVCVCVCVCISIVIINEQFNYWSAIYIRTNPVNKGCLQNFAQLLHKICTLLWWVFVKYFHSSSLCLNKGSISCRLFINTRIDFDYVRDKLFRTVIRGSAVKQPDVLASFTNDKPDRKFAVYCFVRMLLELRTAHLNGAAATALLSLRTVFYKTALYIGYTPYITNFICLYIFTFITHVILYLNSHFIFYILICYSNHVKEISYFLRRQLYLKIFVDRSLKMALWKKPKHICHDFLIIF